MRRWRRCRCIPVAWLGWFLTATGSWIYPEPSLIKLGGVPLFSGFMYSCIGSYLCRVWRLFDFRFTGHPSRRRLIGLSAAIYLNFFTDHYGIDLRLVLFGWAALLFLPTTVHFKVWRVHRSRPMAGPWCRRPSSARGFCC